MHHNIAIHVTLLFVAKANHCSKTSIEASQKAVIDLVYIWGDMGHNLILSSAHTDKWPIFVAKIELPSLLKEATYRVVLLMATFLWLVIMAYTRNERIKFSLCFSTFVILTVDCSMSKYSRGWSLGKP